MTAEFVNLDDIIAEMKERDPELWARAQRRARIMKRRLLSGKCTPTITTLDIDKSSGEIVAVREDVCDFTKPGGTDCLWD